MNSKFFNNDDETAFPFKKKKEYKKNYMHPLQELVILVEIVKQFKM